MPNGWVCEEEIFNPLVDVGPGGRGENIRTESQAPGNNSCTRINNENNSAQRSCGTADRIVPRRGSKVDVNIANMCPSSSVIPAESVNDESWVELRRFAECLNC